MKYKIAASIVLLMFASCKSNEPKRQAVKETKNTQYKLASVQQGGTPSIIKLPAQLAAFQEVSIFPKVNGYVKQVLVDIGSNVPAGTLLMTLEAPELEQAALQAKEKYARTKADYSIDKERYNRLLEANKTPGAISPMDISTIRAKLEADSALCNAEKANWQMQQAMLDYLQVRAPFAGTITERNVHPGALVNASAKDKPMLELKQNSHLRLQVDVPETMAANLKLNDTVSFYVGSMPGKKMVGRIARKASNVNYQLRNERIEVDVPNKDGSLSSGMYADVTLYAKGNKTALSIPKSAIIISTERKYVVVVRKGKTQKIDILTGIYTNNNVEVFGELEAGDQVIENASDDIEEGVQIVNNGR